MTSGCERLSGPLPQPAPELMLERRRQDELHDRSDELVMR